jgi:hypothetical protein
MTKLELKAESLGVVPIFYYVSPEDCVARTTTVCLLIKEKEVMARGVAVCSPLDNFEKRIGRAKALGRAIQAIVRKETSGEICSQRFYCSHNNQHVTLEDAEERYKAKSNYLPKLTQWEKELVKGK